MPDIEWRKLRQLEGSVVDKHLTPYLFQELPKTVLECALHELLPEALPEAMDQELLVNHFVASWVFFNWIPEEDFDLDYFDPQQTISQNYITIHGDRLTSEEKRFIAALNKTHYSFYSILAVEPEKSLTVKDILLGTTHTIKERQGTYYLKRGDVTFSRILTLDNQSIFVGMMPFAIPTKYHNNLLDFKEWLIKENNDQTLTTALLREEFNTDLYDYLFDLIKAAFENPIPKLCNTDGDLMQFTKSTFTLAIDPIEAVADLLPLTLSKDLESLLNIAKYNKSGDIKKIEIPWLKKGNKKHKDWENIVMGNITIEKNELTLETNSEKRNKKGQQLLNKYLGNAISFQKTVIESPEKILNSKRSKQPKKNNDHLMQLSEVQEKIKTMAKTHWENWLNEPIPALKNQTPIEATKTEKGRERLESLLLQFERNSAQEKNDTLNLMEPDIDFLRKTLGLTKDQA